MRFVVIIQNNYLPVFVAGNIVLNKIGEIKKGSSR